MTTKKAQRRAEVIAPGRSLILTRREQKTVHRNGKDSYTSECCVTVFDKEPSNNCTQLTGPDWLVVLDKLRSAIPFLP